MHGAKAAASSLHSKDTPDSLAENAKLGVGSLLGSEGAESSMATGGVPSTRTVGCGPCNAKGLVERRSSVSHVQRPSAGADAVIETVSVPPGQSSVVFPVGFLRLTAPFAISVPSATQVLAVQPPAALVVALADETLKPTGMPIRARWARSGESASFFRPIEYTRLVAGFTTVGSENAV